MHAAARHCLLAVLTALFLAACSGGDYQDVLRSLMEKQRLVEQIRYQLLVASAAAKNAVLAPTGEAATDFADKARAALDAAKNDLARLDALVAKGRENKEIEALARVTADIGQWEPMDATLLDLAGRNTNLRAARLTQTEATQAVNRLEQALAPVLDGPDCPAAREGFRALTASLTILSLLDRHIDEASDATMDGLEAAMAANGATARAGLDRLAGLVAPDAPSLVQARAASADLGRITGEIVGLSRENSNINALALVMGRGRQIVAQTLDDLAILGEAVAAKDFKATR